MEALKQIKPGFFAKFINKAYWPYYLLILAIILVVALVALYVFLRRGKIKASAVSLPPEKKKPTLAPGCLVLSWRRFLEQLPGGFRRSLGIYQPFVVLGESGSGKTTLIDSCTDWQGHSAQFLPSYANDPTLQIYLGSTMLVIEAPAALLNDTSKEARTAFIRLWKKIPRKKDPMVVLVLDGWSLSGQVPEQLKRCAQLMRGKINTMARVCRKPVRVGIALTHMDLLEGFDEFTTFLKDNAIALKLEFNSEADLKNIQHCLEPYESYLSLALTTLSAERYLKIISFFRQIPDVLKQVAAFTRILRARDPMSPEPEMVRLSLASPGTGSAEVCNPFASSISVQDVEKLKPHLTHQIAAAALLLLGIAYFYGGYVYERALLLEVRKSLERVEAAPPAFYNQKMHQLVLDFSFSLKKDPELAFLPNYFPYADRRIKRRIMEDIRSFYFTPKLTQILAQPNPQLKSLYLAALTYADSQNELGRLVLGRIVDWTEVLGFPKTLIRDYVSYNNTEDVKTNIDFFHIVKPTGVSPIEDPLTWLTFLHNVVNAEKQPLITTSYLDFLRREAKSLLKASDSVTRYDQASEVAAALMKSVKGCPNFGWIQRRQSRVGQKALREALKQIEHTGIAYPPPEGMQLSQLMESLGVMNTLAKRSKNDKPYQFQLAGEQFSLSPGEWKALANRSRMTLFIKDFVALNRTNSGFIFFQKQSHYPEIILNPGNDGQLFFAGKARIDGRLTKMAFEQDVKPVLTKMPELLKSLPIAEQYKRWFSTFISSQTEAYAGKYAGAYTAYYQAFHIQAANQGELSFLLGQLPLSTSQFQDLFNTMKENTVLDLGDSPYLKVFGQKLAPFDFIRRLMADKPGTPPELDRYKALIQQLHDQIESTEPYVAKDKADDAAALKSLLSPLGRVSLAMLRGESDSYLNLVRAWLKSTGIDPQWQTPFLEPVQLACGLGRSDIESTVNKVWNDLDLTCIQPVLHKFPLDPESEVEVLPEELEKVISPNGTFWKTFRQYLAPVCQEASGKWFVRVPPYGVIRIPERMLKVANQLSVISSSLWDAKGLPIPFSITVKSSPLPPRVEKGLTPVLAYLKCGKATALGFNQQPMGQTMNIEWWKSQSASVGLEFQDAKKGGSKTYKEVSVPESFWGFFRLLRKAACPEKGVYSWQFADPGNSLGAVQIEYSMKPDPWAVFHPGPESLDRTDRIR